MSEQNTNHKTSVIIVGAGPTGLSLAVQLLRYGIDFIILEKNEKTTHLSKAVVVQARTLEIFEELGLADKAVKEGRLTTAMNMFYKGKKKVSLDLAGLGDGISQFSFALSLEQSKTEKLLVDYLLEKGKTVRWKSEFLRAEQSSTGVTVYYKDANGNEQIIEGEYLVGCDGAHSLVRHEMNQSFEGDTVPKLFYVTDVIMSSPVVNTDELFMFIIKKGFILFFPMEGTGHYRIIGILADNLENHETFTFEDIQDTVKEQMMVPVEFKEVKWFSTYKVHSREASSFMNGRYFIAGDAGHIHTPAGGQGMNTGIQDAYNLAWKLALVITKKTSAAMLETYNTERMGNAKHLLRTTDRMFDVMSGSNWFFNFLRIRVFPIVARFISKRKRFNKKIFPLISQTGIAYPGSVLTIKSSIGKVKAGDRMHYFVFADGKNIFSYLTEPSFKLIFFGTGENRSSSIKSPDLPLSLLSFAEIPTAIFNKETDFYILLRPDNHISYIGKELSSCQSLLDKFSISLPVQ